MPSQQFVIFSNAASAGC